MDGLDAGLGGRTAALHRAQDGATYSQEQAKVNATLDLGPYRGFQQHEGWWFDAKAIINARLKPLRKMIAHMGMDGYIYDPKVFITLANSVLLDSEDSDDPATQKQERLYDAYLNLFAALTASVGKSTHHDAAEIHSKLMSGVTNGDGIGALAMINRSAGISAADSAALTWLMQASCPAKGRLVGKDSVNEYMTSFKHMKAVAGNKYTNAVGVQVLKRELENPNQHPGIIATMSSIRVQERQGIPTTAEDIIALIDALIESEQARMLTLNIHSFGTAPTQTHHRTQVDSSASGEAKSCDFCSRKGHTEDDCRAKSRAAALEREKVGEVGGRGRGRNGVTSGPTHGGRKCRWGSNCSFLRDKGVCRFEHTSAEIAAARTGAPPPTFGVDGASSTTPDPASQRMQQSMYLGNLVQQMLDAQMAPAPGPATESHRMQKSGKPSKAKPAPKRPRPKEEEEEDDEDLRITTAALQSLSIVDARINAKKEVFTCKAKTKAGKDCSYKAMDGLKFCGIHAQMKRKEGAADTQLARQQALSHQATLHGSKLELGKLHRWVQDTGASGHSARDAGQTYNELADVETSNGNVITDYAEAPTHAPLALGVAKVMRLGGDPCTSVLKTCSDTGSTFIADRTEAGYILDQDATDIIARARRDGKFLQCIRENNVPVIYTNDKGEVVPVININEMREDSRASIIVTAVRKVADAVVEARNCSATGSSPMPASEMPSGVQPRTTPARALARLGRHGADHGCGHAGRLHRGRLAGRAAWLSGARRWALRAWLGRGRLRRLRPRQDEAVPGAQDGPVDPRQGRRAGPPRGVRLLRAEQDRDRRDDADVPSWDACLRRLQRPDVGMASQGHARAAHPADDRQGRRRFEV